MSFEIPVSKDASDPKRQVIIERVKARLTSIEEISVGKEKQKIRDILASIEDDDFGPAFLYLEDAIIKLKQDLRSRITRNSQPLIEDLENLKDSLLLTEK